MPDKEKLMRNKSPAGIRLRELILRAAAQEGFSPPEHGGGFPRSTVSAVCAELCGLGVIFKGSKDGYRDVRYFSTQDAAKAYTPETFKLSRRARKRLEQNSAFPRVEGAGSFTFAPDAKEDWSQAKVYRHPTPPPRFTAIDLPFPLNPQRGRQLREDPPTDQEPS